MGSESYEILWLRSVSHETYLWPEDLVDLNPDGFKLLPCFDQLKSPALTASGKAKDRFHFYERSDDVYEHFELGQSQSYGVEWDKIDGIYTALYVQPNSPAEVAGVRRGMTLTSIDSVAVSMIATDALYAKLFPETPQTHIFTLVPQSGGAPENISLTSVNLQEQPVFPLKILSGLQGETIGYLDFHSFNGPSQGALISAVNDLSLAHVDELVLDLRYNGGGYMNVAGELAYMLAGSSKTAGKIFAHEHTNAYVASQVSAKYLEIPFPTTTERGSKNVGANQALPQLALKRLYVLTGEGTCSASELLINGLRGVDFPVIQIGSTTCGKPYGFFWLKNCGYDYYTINLQTRNAKGFGDYADGMSPVDALVNQGSPAGCLVEDDLSKALGDTNEKRLAAALQHISTGACSSTAAALVGEFLGAGKLLGQPSRGLNEHVWRSNMVK